MDDLVERIDAEIKRQRETRGTSLDYGTPDPLLVEARARITTLTAELASVKSTRVVVRSCTENEVEKAVLSGVDPLELMFMKSDDHASDHAWSDLVVSFSAMMDAFAERITTLTAERDALKRQLEAKAKLTITDVRIGPPIYNPSTALETGEWKK